MELEPTPEDAMPYDGEAIVESYAEKLRIFAEVVASLAVADVEKYPVTFSADEGISVAIDLVEGEVLITHTGPYSTTEGVLESSALSTAMAAIALLFEGFNTP